MVTVAGFSPRSHRRDIFRVKSQLAKSRLSRILVRRRQNRRDVQSSARLEFGPQGLKTRARVKIFRTDTPKAHPYLSRIPPVLDMSRHLLLKGPIRLFTNQSKKQIRGEYVEECATWISVFVHDFNRRLGAVDRSGQRHGERSIRRRIAWSRSDGDANRHRARTERCDQ